MEISDATYAQQVENAHNSCYGVAKERAFASIGCFIPTRLMIRLRVTLSRFSWI
jgi:hypothetical protein